MPNFDHPFVGRLVVYRDPHAEKPEQGPITSVNESANLVFVRYGTGSTSAATACDDRLTFLDGTPVRLPPVVDTKTALENGDSR